MQLGSFLARHRHFGGWREKWIGVPLEFRTFLADELPPRAYIGSVRAIVLCHDKVLLVRSSPPILSVGGRCKDGESVEETLLREVGEESGWVAIPIGVIGFIHCRHLDAQRPDWGRPAPDFVDPIFAMAALRYDPAMLGPDETRCEFVSIAEVERLGIDEINQTFLREALRKRSQSSSPTKSSSSQT
jgi:8-oxo-dGTP pyrophosphatase MutT (NUDIX family)